jgi:hypothetical protein
MIAKTENKIVTGTKKSFNAHTEQAPYRHVVRIPEPFSLIREQFSLIPAGKKLQHGDRCSYPISISGLSVLIPAGITRSARKRGPDSGTPILGQSL